MFSSKQVLNDTTAPHEGALPFLVTLASRESGEFPTIPELFATVAREQTSAPAVAGGSWEPSYEQLDQAANAIAHAILDRPGIHGDRVALLLHHDTLQIAACLGVLKAGRIVVVLNPGDPAARHNEILADASPALIITEASLVECSQVTIHPASDVVIIAPGAPETLVAAPPLSTQPSDIAFLVYTSGSTGKPKGVMQTHESVAHNAWRLAKGLALTRQDRIILLGSLSGGQGVGTTWTALLNGATLCPFAIMDRGVTGLAHWMRQMHITIYVSSASTFRHFMQTLEPGDQFPEVRVVRLASEHATSTDHDQFKKHFSAHCRLAPTFSLSETGNLTQGSLGIQDAPSEGRLPVGHPSPGVEILLLDQNGAEVPVCELGEVVVQCPQISLGYWRNEPLTKERYRLHPTQPDLRRFHTGDMGRWNVNGELVIEGRKDAQVKIRGYRIELAAVESALQCLPEVLEAIVLPVESNDHPRLAAFVTPRQGRRLERAQVRAALRERLPTYMVPSEIFLLDEIPLTPHGKPNRAALVALTENARLTGMGGEPVNEVEDVLAGIWAEAFNLEMVGRDDDFFDLGGDSLLAAVVSARINDSLGVTVDMESFNTHSTVAGMGSFVQDSLEKMLALGTGKPATIPKWESLTGPLSYLEERLWAMFKDPKIQQAYNMGAYHEIKGALNVLLFRECINTVLQRHEVFSTAYTQTDAGAQRTIREFCPVEIPLHDLSDDPDAEAAIQATRHALVAVPFDFEHGPLVRMELFKLGPENYRLVRIHSHLISDGWSWKVFFKDLAECYAAAMERREPSLKPLRLQYSDFAAWQRTFMARDGGQFQKQLAWWKDQLSGGAQPVALPFRRDTPISDATPEDGNLTWGIPARTSLALDRLGRVERATYYMTRLAGFAATIGSLTGQTDFVIGSYATNRDRVELQDIFGFFANLVTLRFNYDRTMTFRSWLGRVRTLVTEVHGRADLPYEVLCQELRQGGVEPPEVRVIFSISGRLPPMSVAGLQIMPVKGRSHRMPWGMSLLFHRWTESQDCNCNFDANLYESEGMRALLETYKTMLALVAEFPDVPMHQLHERAHADKGANLNLQKA